MKLIRFLEKQYLGISVSGINGIKIRLILILSDSFRYFRILILSPFLVVIRVISPFVVIRIGPLVSSRIGHFAGNIELYLIEKEVGINVPDKYHIDLFFVEKKVCNTFLYNKWKQKLIILPSVFLSPIYKLNSYVSGGSIHQINFPSGDRDIHNLLDKSISSSISFTAEELKFGEARLKDLGVTKNSSIVCLIVRDCAYLNSISNKENNQHNYRDGNVKNYLLMAEELTKKGYVVIRMGAIVKDIFESKNPMIIDYASSGKRSDFMDIYLGSRCEFCVSTSTGWDSVPFHLFRKPCLFVTVPLGIFFTFTKQTLNITKFHYSHDLGRYLTLEEIGEYSLHLSMGSNLFRGHKIELIEPSPIDIWEAVEEMIEISKKSFNYTTQEQNQQKQFWNFYSRVMGDDLLRLHGELKSRIGKKFLQRNAHWLLK